MRTDLYSDDTQPVRDWLSGNGDIPTKALLRLWRRTDLYTYPVLPVSWLAVNWRHIFRQDERDHGSRD